jgi:hypothetical protein
MDKTGFDAVGFRPFGNQVAVILTDEDLEVLESKNSKTAERDEKLKNSGIIQGASGKPKIIKGKKLESDQRAEELERKRENRTFTVACVSEALVDKESVPQVGDEISLMAGTMVEVKIEDQYYGVVAVHRCLAVHKTAIKP